MTIETDAIAVVERFRDKWRRRDASLVHLYDEILAVLRTLPARSRPRPRRHQANGSEVMTPPLKTTAEQRAELAELRLTWFRLGGDDAHRLTSAMRTYTSKLLADIETLLAANKALEDENALFLAQLEAAEQALKRAGEVTDERVEAVANVINPYVMGAFGEDEIISLRNNIRERARAVLTAALAIQPKGDGEPADDPVADHEALMEE